MPNDYLLQENSGRIALENGTGFIIIRRNAPPGPPVVILVNTTALGFLPVRRSLRREN